MTSNGNTRCGTTRCAPPGRFSTAPSATPSTTGFLFDRLLPRLKDAFGSELCRTWAEREIVAISDYQFTGEVSGPSDHTLTVGATEIPTNQYFEGPVVFTFQGESFETTAQWVVQNGEVY